MKISAKVVDRLINPHGTGEDLNPQKVEIFSPIVLDDKTIRHLAVTERGDLVILYYRLGKYYYSMSNFLGENK